MSISLVGWEAAQVAPALQVATVALPKSTIRTEAVSRRLVRSLPHPDRSASLPTVAFNAAGELIVAGYPSGVVQVLEPETGKELRTFETPRGYRGSFNYLQLSPDRRLLFVGLDGSTFEPVQEGEKKTYFRRYNGEILVFDLAAGKQLESLKVEPRRGVMSLAISPDGSRVATMEYSSGSNEDFDRLRAIYLWDVAARKAIKLRDGHGDPRFSPDGRTVFVTVNDSATKTGVVHAYSAETGRETGKIESRDGPWPGFAFSPDGKLAAAFAVDAESKRPAIRLYDSATLRPGADLTAAGLDAGARFTHLTFSPDGRRLAAVASTTAYLWDVESWSLRKSWPLDTPGRVWHLTFDPPGKRIAVSTWFIPPELKGARDETVTPQDFPQPRVFLIDVAKEKAETIVCPHGWWGRPAFSPDGRRLAVGGAGAVHVFDVGE